MKFFLTIFICSAISGECIIPNNEPYIYPKTFDSHYECVRAGLSESYEILYAEKFFDEKGITQYKLYPKFGCDEIPVVEEKT